MNTPTPEKSIEKIFKNFWFYAGAWHNADCAFVCVDHGVCNCNTTANKKEITQTLQTERQKREEMVEAKAIEVREEEANEYNKIIELEVEAERERICNDLDEMWSALYGAYLNSHDLRELIKNVIIQPNNPK